MGLTSLSASGYTVHSMIDRYANGGITMAYSQPIADVLREFFVLSNIDAGFEEQAGCGRFHLPHEAALPHADGADDRARARG